MKAACRLLAASQSKVMKKRIPLLLSIVAVLAIAAFCSKDPNAPVSPEEAASELKGYSEKICAKMSECFQEQMRNMPAEQRAMAERMFPTGDVCVARMNEGFERSRAQESAGETKPLTRAELEKAKACVEQMSNIACTDMMSGKMPEACQGFQQR